MRIGTDHTRPSTPAAQSRVASSRSDTGFADSLTTAVASEASSSGGSPPELSAATYRLMASVFMERGDGEAAARYLAKVPDAREAGLPAVPSGVLAENGRWDYNSAAAALPETGIFDSASGQGARSFDPYVMPQTTPAPDECPPTETAAGTTRTPATPSDLADRLRYRGGAATTSAASAVRAAVEGSLIDRIG